MRSQNSERDGGSAVGRRPADGLAEQMTPRGAAGGATAGMVKPVGNFLVVDDAAQQRECNLLIDAAGIGRVLPDRFGLAHFETLALMERAGGSFVQSLAETWRRADAENHARLFAAFEHYYTTYARDAAAAAGRGADGLRLSREDLAQVERLGGEG